MVLSFRVVKMLNKLNTTVQKQVKEPFGGAVKREKLPSREFIK